MKGNFIRINIILSKKSQTNLKNSLCKMKLKILNFSFFSKSALGKIFYLIGLGLYSHELCKNAKMHSNIILVSNLT